MLDETRLNKVGIDRIVINNFKISNFDSLEKKQINSSVENVEKLEKKTDLFTLIYFVTFQGDKEACT